MPDVITLSRNDCTKVEPLSPDPGNALTYRDWSTSDLQMLYWVPLTREQAHEVCTELEGRHSAYFCNAAEIAALCALAQGRAITPAIRRKIIEDIGEPVMDWLVAKLREWQPRVVVDTEPR